MKRTIVWFRKDLRLHDNPALWEAANEGIVIPVFIWSEEDRRAYAASEASAWWLYHSLKQLETDLLQHGVQLVIKQGPDFDAIVDVMEQVGAESIYFNERYEPTERDRQMRIVGQLSSIGMDVRTFHGNLLFSPELLNKQGEPYKVFTSFWKRGLQEVVDRPLPVPELQGVENDISSLAINALGLPTDLGTLQKYWQPGERAGTEQWAFFADDGMLHYKKERDLIAKGTSSRLSPYLAAGNSSARAIWHAAKRINEETKDVTAHQSIEAFLKQLMWREFAYHQLIHFPTMTDQPLRKQFNDFPWVGTPEQYNLWKEGKTGYPLVDAGMRELRETGMMHNRVRMVAASFLVKHLLIPWQEGYAWFQHALVDFDTANNATGWQWVTGCGIDAAPYFRIFNPYLQSEKFDPNGAYIKQWIPELANLPAKYIHKPFEAPEDILQEAGIQLGVTYPYPIVDHATARKRALHAYDTIKGRSEENRL